MDVCIDVGNSSVKLGFFNQKTLKKACFFKIDEFPKIKEYLLKSGMKTLERAMLCSSSPKNASKIIKIISPFVSQKPLMLGRDFSVKIQSEYKKLKELGQDRMVNILGFNYIYPGPGILVSFGTAITIDYIDSAKKHKGGIILPGLDLMAHSLERGTASLPCIKVEKINKKYGKSTVECIKSGIIYGTANAIAGFVSSFEEEIKQSPIILAVGGQAVFMKQYCPYFTHIDSYHTVKSLSYILSYLGNSSLFKK